MSQCGFEAFGTDLGSSRHHRSTASCRLRPQTHKRNQCELPLICVPSSYRAGYFRLDRLCLEEADEKQRKRQGRVYAYERNGNAFPYGAPITSISVTAVSYTHL